MLELLFRRSNDQKDFLESFQDGLVVVSGSKGIDVFSRKTTIRLRQASSIENIFELLSDYWNFFNCFLLYYVIDHFVNDDDIKKKKDVFALKLTNFLQTTKVSEFHSVCSDMEQFPSDGTLEIFAYIPFKTMTLKDVEMLKVEITRQASLKPHTLFFMNPGNNILKWKMPKHLIPLFASAIDNTFLEEHHITSLQIDGVDLKSYIKQVIYVLLCY